VGAGSLVRKGDDRGAPKPPAASCMTRAAPKRSASLPASAAPRGLAAVGTALPKSLIPIIALLSGDGETAELIAIGAVIGAPFLLATIAMLLVSLSAIGFQGRRSSCKRVAAHPLDDPGPPGLPRGLPPGSSRAPAGPRLRRVQAVVERRGFVSVLCARLLPGSRPRCCTRRGPQPRARGRCPGGDRPGRRPAPHRLRGARRHCGGPAQPRGPERRGRHRADEPAGRGAGLARAARSTRRRGRRGRVSAVVRR